MDYGVVAGSLVTLSFILLFIEARVRRIIGKRGTLFLLLYSSGVCCWIALGVFMNISALVLIGSMQLLFLALYWSTRLQQHES